MDKFKRVLIVIVLLVVLAGVCSIGGSGLLNNTSHVMVAQANLEAWKTTRFMASTIDRQSTSLVIGMVVLAVLALGLGLISAYLLINRGRQGEGAAFLTRPSAPKFLSLGPDAEDRLRRMTPSQRRELLHRLYEVVEYLEDGQGRGRQKRLPVYEKNEARINWG